MPENTTASTAHDIPTDLDFIPTIVRIIVIIVLLMIPIKIVRMGYLPVLDDTIADAAKAVSGREWTDILVLRPEFALDPHIGWHGFLHAMAGGTNWGAHEVATFSVVVLFLVLACSPLIWFKRPEAWIAALTALVAVGASPMERYLLGRPFLVSCAVLANILLLWHSRRSIAPRKGTVASLVAMFALAVVLHGSWYLWVLVIAAFFMASEREWAKLLGLAWVIGTVAGAVLTGHPVEYLVESVRMGSEAFGRHRYESTLVQEFKPLTYGLPGVLLIAGIVIFRRLASGMALPPLRQCPAFCLGCVGYVLGYKAMRFWGDWGMVALLVQIATDLEVFFLQQVPIYSPRRLTIALGLAGTLFLMSTNDASSRWTISRETRYLASSDPEASGWLPDDGGVLYSSEMALFYQTLYANPSGRWRYITGFEPVMMPLDDFNTFQSIGLSHGNPLAYMPWVRKLRPPDRVALHWGEQPAVRELEWKKVDGVWLGRLPRTPGTAPTVR